MKSLIVFVAVGIALCNAQCQLLTFSSPDKSWFDLDFEPSAIDDQIDRAIYGWGWVRSRKNDDKADDKHSFRGVIQQDQKITVSAADGSLWRLQKMSIKSTNVDEMVIRGIDEDGDVVFEHTKSPKDMAKFPKWEKTISRARKHVIESLEIEAKLHEHSVEDRKAEQYVWLRGLKVEACPESN